MDLIDFAIFVVVIIIGIMWIKRFKESIDGGKRKMFKKKKKVEEVKPVVEEKEEVSAEEVINRLEVMEDNLFGMKEAIEQLQSKVFPEVLVNSALLELQREVWPERFNTEVEAEQQPAKTLGQLKRGE
jgi:hypothetical protein